MREPAAADMPGEDAGARLREAVGAYAGWWRQWDLHVEALDTQDPATALGLIRAARRLVHARRSYLRNCWGFDPFWSLRHADRPRFERPARAPQDDIERWVWWYAYREWATWHGVYAAVRWACDEAAERKVDAGPLIVERSRAMLRLAALASAVEMDISDEGLKSQGSASLAGWAEAHLSGKNRRATSAVAASGVDRRDLLPSAALLGWQDWARVMGSSIEAWWASSGDETPRVAQSLHRGKGTLLSAIVRHVESEASHDLALDDEAWAALASKVGSADTFDRDEQARIELRDLAVHVDLTPRERDVFALMMDDLPESEIGDRLGIKRGTVSALKQRVRKKLRAAA